MQAPHAVIGSEIPTPPKKKRNRHPTRHIVQRSFTGSADDRRWEYYNMPYDESHNQTRASNVARNERIIVTADPNPVTAYHYPLHVDATCKTTYLPRIDAYLHRYTFPQTMPEHRELELSFYNHRNIVTNA